MNVNELAPYVSFLLAAGLVAFVVVCVGIAVTVAIHDWREYRPSPEQRAQHDLAKVCRRRIAP